mgnify:CR=1 FL=1
MKAEIINNNAVALLQGYAVLRSVHRVIFLYRNSFKRIAAKSVICYIRNPLTVPASVTQISYGALSAAGLEHVKMQSDNAVFYNGTEIAVKLFST